MVLGSEMPSAAGSRQQQALVRSMAARCGQEQERGGTCTSHWCVPTLGLPSICPPPPPRRPCRRCRYIEACESGSIFDGLLQDNLSVYATTAANGHESSWGEPAAPRSGRGAAPSRALLSSGGLDRLQFLLRPARAICLQVSGPTEALPVRVHGPAGTYCPGMNPSPPPEFGTCLGDLYSVAWMENADHADLTLGGWLRGWMDASRWGLLSAD